VCILARETREVYIYIYIYTVATIGANIKIGTIIKLAQYYFERKILIRIYFHFLLIRYPLVISSMI